ncbi:MAG: hypothetical protein EBZ47_06295 [Chlamydiae bacterium]|nr:hypothetical protein [Chlamydiota bacterium]
MDIKDVKRRKGLDSHLEIAISRTSSQTGWVHLFYDAPHIPQQDTIATLENMYAILGLFRTRLSERILGGRERLTKLLAFEVEGNFPVYLHQYPELRDRSLSVHILPVLYYLLKDFSAVMGEELCNSAYGLVERILAHATKMEEKKPLPFGARVKWKAFTKELKVQQPTTHQEWADYLIALHMMESVAPWVSQEIQKAASYWNATIGLFLPPGIMPIHEKGLPKLTLVDLILWQYESREWPALNEHACLGLKSALLYPFLLPKEQLVFSSKAHAEIQGGGGSIPWATYWREDGYVYSLALAQNAGGVEIRKEGEDIYFVCTLPQEIPREEESSEVAWYLSAHSSCPLAIEGQSASAFGIHDTVTLQTPSKRWDLTMEIKEGEGRFLGHLLKASRPCERSKEAFDAYDWKIAIRTLERSSSCSLVLRLKPIHG